MTEDRPRIPTTWRDSIAEISAKSPTLRFLARLGRCLGVFADRHSADVMPPGRDRPGYVVSGLKVMAWNVMRGGGARCERLISGITTVGPDVVLLSEYQPDGTCDLAKRLADCGYVHQVGGVAPKGAYTAQLLASRHPLEPGELKYTSSVYGDRFHHVRVHGWNLLGAFVPCYSNKDRTRKRLFWEFITSGVGPAMCDERALLIGDMNTGLHYRDEEGATGTCSDYMQRLLDTGWRDAWVEKNPRDRPPGTWYSNTGKPFRLDHAILSPASPRAKDIGYPSTLGEEPVLGTGNLSDHLPVVISLP